MTNGGGGGGRKMANAQYLSFILVIAVLLYFCLADILEKCISVSANTPPPPQMEKK
jgi:hypothetical protein